MGNKLEKKIRRRKMTEFNFFAQVKQQPGLRGLSRHMRDSGNYSSNSSSMNSLDKLDMEDIHVSNETTTSAETSKYLNLALSSRWSFYYLRNDKGLPDNSNWDDRLEYVASFGTIGEFWAVYQHVKLPSYLPQVIKRRNKLLKFKFIPLFSFVLTLS